MWLKTKIKKKQENNLALEVHVFKNSVKTDPHSLKRKEEIRPMSHVDLCSLTSITRVNKACKKENCEDWIYHMQNKIMTGRICSRE